MQNILKDESLDCLAAQGANIAQFASWGPDGCQRFARIRGLEPGHRFGRPADAARAIMSRIQIPSINIRTFLPEKPDGNPFLYGLVDPEEIDARVLGFTRDGYYVIVNETIRVNDGGFSGVILGDIIEGAPNETPRCVEKPGCLRLPREMGFRLVKLVYGFDFHMPYDENSRVEFSIHPHCVGYAHDFVVLWQEGRYPGELPKAPGIVWPNKYSQYLGDKAFGLLIGHLLGMPVPRTTVFGRHIPQFTFGTPTHSGEPVWLRTAPKIQAPGQFTTKRGHTDPYAIMQQDDPDATRIAAILFMDGVAARYSGSAITDSEGALLIEGVRSYGDAFMVGEQAPELLPENVIGQTRFLASRLKAVLGDVRFEWVYDGVQTWLVQLHTGRIESRGDTIVAGKPRRWVSYETARGLEPLRELAEKYRGKKTVGIVLIGDVGLTSHFGDILRKAQVPSRLVRPEH